MSDTKAAENSTKTTRGRPFEKGRSGNPGGRPKTDERVQKALRAATPKAAETLIELLDANEPKIRIQAANSILDRVCGKPAQRLDVEQSEPVRITLADDVKRYLV